MYRKPTSRTVTILSGQTTSDVFEVGDYTLMGIILDAANTGATATFQACATRTGTFRAVSDSDGNVVTFATNAAAAIGLSGAELDALAPFQFFKIVSAGAEGADRTLTVVLK